MIPNVFIEADEQMFAHGDMTTFVGKDAIYARLYTIIPSPGAKRSGMGFHGQGTLHILLNMPARLTFSQFWKGAFSLIEGAFLWNLMSEKGAFLSERGMIIIIWSNMKIYCGFHIKLKPFQKLFLFKYSKIVTNPPGHPDILALWHMWLRQPVVFHVS